MHSWPLTWSHGHGTVEALGGMLGPVYFRLPNGSEVQPFAVFPWADEPLPADQPRLHGLMSKGRGEWPCVPFGLNPDPAELGWPHPIHGECAHGLWQRIDDGSFASEIHLAYESPAPGPICRIERLLSGIHGQATVDCRLSIRVRKTCQLSVGLHPTLRLPGRVGALKIKPGDFEFALSYPDEVEPGADVVAPGCGFSDLAQTPRRGGGFLDMTVLPLPFNTESLIQLCGINGKFEAVNSEEGYIFDLNWDAGKLPSCLLWISNAGRSAWPWSNRHYALGIEPICGEFDLGVVSSRQSNCISQRGVATTVLIEPEEPLEISYQLGVRPLETA